MQVSKIKRREGHNIKNLLTAAAIADGYTTRERIVKVASEFCGLEHRCEEIGIKDDVRYINSSIDTTPNRTFETLRSFDTNVIIILGGKSKGCDYSILREPLNKHAKLAILTGDCRNELSASLKGACDTCIIDDFEEAVIYATVVAEPGDTVLLSPAATSYDAFENFENRGNKFKEIIDKIHKNRS